MQPDISLSTIIRTATPFTEAQKWSLWCLVAKHCRAAKISRLERKIFNVPPSCWANFGIFQRVLFTPEGRAHYCAGQSYPDGIKTVRECILS